MSGFRSVLTLVALAASAVWAPAGAQQSLTFGAPEYGTLGSGDRMSDNSYYDEYVFSVSSSQTVTLDLTSDEFDTYLRLYSLDGGLHQIETDDDGGDGLDSQIQRHLSPGQYLVRATSFSSRGTGAYRLSATGGYTNTTGAVAIGIGQSTWAELSGSDRNAGGDYYDDYTVYVSAGTRIQVDMTASFDTYLSIGRGTGSGFSRMDSNDDGGEGLNARLQWTAPSSGTYTLRATSWRSGSTGSYNLAVSNLGSPRSVAWTTTGTLGSGDSRNSSGGYYDEWTRHGNAGERVVYELRSDDFDTYLEIGYGSHGAFSSFATDDDGADTPLDSRLEVILPRDGTYTIRARSFGNNSTGYYVIERY